MDKITLSKASRFSGEVTPPPDKSISHRAVMFSSLAKGRSIVRNFLRAKDTESTMKAFISLGIEISDKQSVLIINGKGLHGLAEPSDILDCGNSGTTIRLISGILSGNPFFSVLTGDSSLRTRPMARVIQPLSQMGARIRGRGGDKYAPLAIQGGRLKPISCNMPVASAQVKSSILLAGLYAEGRTEIIEPAKSRDHTERMLPAFGADLSVDGLKVTVKGGTELKPADTDVPGDFSSAAFFIIASLLIPNSEIIIRNVCINPTRTGLLNVLKKMGADISIENLHSVSGEPVSDIICRGGSNLKAVDVSEEDIPALIDEFPVLCVAASQAEGTTTIRGAAELRVKESDRIKAMASELGKMGVKTEEFPDGLSIKGTDHLQGADVESHHDHRIAMAMAIAALRAEGTTTIHGSSAVDISFPGFFSDLKRLKS